jgi:hypothetical protein
MHLFQALVAHRNVHVQNLKTIKNHIGYFKKMNLNNLINIRKNRIKTDKFKDLPLVKILFQIRKNIIKLKTI